jgi:hypothetical protein
MLRYFACIEKSYILSQACTVFVQKLFFLFSEVTYKNFSSEVTLDIVFYLPGTLFFSFLPLTDF